MYVLLLNSTFEPLNVISWKKAVTLLFKGKIEIIEEYDNRDLKSISTKFKHPSIVKLQYYVKINNFKRINLNKDNIYIRDSYTCAYCGKRFPKKMLSLDHIVPSSLGGGKSWDNLVTACFDCNNRKGNRTPEQAGLKLIVKPYRPSFLPNYKLNGKLNHIPETWKTYLYSSKQ